MLDLSPDVLSWLDRAISARSPVDEFDWTSTRVDEICDLTSGERT
jgi:hypothetical protein